MKLLAIDTSQDACSAALLIDGTLEQRIEHAPRRHGELVLSMMDALLAQAGVALQSLDALAFGRGPGSFTGVRIAASVVQGTAFAADLPVVPISTLAAIAQGQFRRGGERQLLAALDARMDEVYWGCYLIGDGGIAELQGEESVCPPHRVPIPPGQGWTGVGHGWGAYRESLGQALGDRLAGARPDVSCEAADVATIGAHLLSVGGQVPAERALPIYLRDRVTFVK